MSNQSLLAGLIDHRIAIFQPPQTLWVWFQNTFVGRNVGK